MSNYEQFLNSDVWLKHKSSEWLHGKLIHQNLNDYVIYMTIQNICRISFKAFLWFLTAHDLR